MAAPILSLLLSSIIISPVAALPQSDTMHSSAPVTNTSPRPLSLLMRRSGLDTDTTYLIVTIVVSSVLGTVVIILLFYLFRFIRQRRTHTPTSMTDSSEGTLKKHHGSGFGSINSSQPAVDLEGAETSARLLPTESNESQNDAYHQGYTHGKNYVAVRSSSPPIPEGPDYRTLPSMVQLQHNRRISMPPQRPPRPDDLAIHPALRDTPEQSKHLLYNNNAVAPARREPRLFRSRPNSLLAYTIPQIEPVTPLTYDAPIDMWIRPPTPPQKSNRRFSDLRPVVAGKEPTAHMVRKPVPVHIVLDPPRFGGLRGSDTEYSSQYSDTPSLTRSNSGSSTNGQRTLTPPTCIGSSDSYSEISLSSSSDAKPDRERKISSLGGSSTRLSNVMENKEDFVEVATYGDKTASHHESEINTERNGDDTEEEASENGEGAVAATPNLVPAPLRIMNRGIEIEVPRLQLPMPMNLEERQGPSGRVYVAA